MAVLFERTIPYRGLEYKVSADLDDAAMMDDKLVVTVKASVRRPPDTARLQESLDLVVNIVGASIEVKARGRLIATVPLTLPFTKAADLFGNDIDIIVDDQAIEQIIGPVGIEELIHLVPADPLLGCLLKGALSTVVGQTIRCWASTPREGTFSQRVHNVGGCLREYGLRMALTFMFRVGRCMAFLGMA
jgi:hypothetical protein